MSEILYYKTQDCLFQSAGSISQTAWFFFTRCRIFYFNMESFNWRCRNISSRCRVLYFKCSILYFKVQILHFRVQDLMFSVPMFFPVSSVTEMENCSSLSSLFKFTVNAMFQVYQPFPRLHLQTLLECDNTDKWNYCCFSYSPLLLINRVLLFLLSASLINLLVTTRLSSAHNKSLITWIISEEIDLTN